MSRIGKQLILVPSGVDVSIKGEIVAIKGPRGMLEKRFKTIIKIELEGDRFKLEPKKVTAESSALWGTYAAILKNMILGVTEGFSKILVIEGIGFKAQVQGGEMVFNLGFSHPVKMVLPEDIEAVVEKNKVKISGIDKELVGEIAAKIRALKKPEPYKGKGIRYEGEIVRRKSGKKAAGSGA